MWFPTYSKSKYLSISPDIIEIWDDSEEPMIGLILRIETLANISAVLDVGQKVRTLD